MNSAELLGVVAGLALAAMVGVLARLALSGGDLTRPKDVRLACPRFHEPVECAIVQDVRTGQWKEVLSCSTFGVPGKLLCDQDCRRTMNLGLRLDVAESVRRPT